MSANRVWIDALTPKQLLFFSKLREKLISEGYEVYFTSRAYREIIGLKEILDIDCIIIGRHGGRTLEEKLLASIERMRDLTLLVKKWKPKIAISHSSPEASRVSFGLRIPHLCVNDSPHSIYVTKLTIPLSELLFTPWIIPKHVWIPFGISEDQIIHYRGLDPVAWLRDKKFSPKILTELGLERHKDIIVVRETESFASYLLDSVKSIAPISDNIVSQLVKTLEKDVQYVILPRYKEQVDYLRRKKWPDNVIVVDKVIDATNLLYFSTLLIGGGGTMNTEAVLLGKPVISVYPGETTLVEKYLIKQKVVFRPRTVGETITILQKILSDKKLREKIRRKGLALLRKLENPIDVILERILSLSK